MQIQVIHVDLISLSKVHLAVKAHPQVHRMNHSIEINLQMKNSSDSIHNTKMVNKKAMDLVMTQISKTITASIRTSTRLNKQGKMLLTENNTKVLELLSNQLIIIINKMEDLTQMLIGNKDKKAQKLIILAGKRNTNGRWEIVSVDTTQTQRNRSLITNGTSLIDIQRDLRKKRRLTKNMNLQKIAHSILIIEVIIRKIYGEEVFGKDYTVLAEGSIHSR